MKVASEWLQAYLGKKIEPKLMAESLERAGVEIEHIEYSNRFHKNLIIGVIKKVMQHPGADRLHLLLVDSGEGDVEVVCGAKNLFLSQKVAFATPGTILPDGTEIKVSTIRGQVSNGMLCSAMELGLGEDHSGILTIESDAAPGSKLCDVWPEGATLDVKSAANRSDLTSVIGLAREISAFNDMSLSLPDLANITYTPHIKVETNKLADRYMMAELAINNEGVSPQWMQQRLVASGVRPINPVVDIGNYVMLELGQPLHIFDADRVKIPVSVRKATSGEALKTLDGVKRTLHEEDLVICDANGIVALAGVMGGEATQVNVDTKRILIESAVFDGVSVRKTAVRHGLRSEASARFERRLPVQLPPVGLARAVQLYYELAQGTLAGASDYINIWPWIQHVGVRPSTISKLFGTPVSADSIVNHLSALGFAAEKFDVVTEAKKHLGKPYVWGAKYKTHGVSAFDCSYLIDYIYSLIGVNIGHTALGQYHFGRSVKDNELKAGDVLFYEGKIEKSATDHYFVRDERGHHHKKQLEGEEHVGHNGMYAGDGKVVMAAIYEFKNGEWVKMNQTGVVEVSLEVFTKNPGYKGARRYVENLDDMVAVTAPWWRPDIRGEHDILEEVARLEGYDKVSATLPAWRPKQVEFDRRLPREWELKNILRAVGLFEVMTYSFVSAQQLEQAGQKLDSHLKLANPKSVEQAYLRSNLLPSLLTATAGNEGYGRSFGMFEISKVFVARLDHAELPKETTHVGIMIRDPKSAYKRTKGVLDALAIELNVHWAITAKQHDRFFPGRSAAISLRGKPLGWIGELHPDLARSQKLSGSVGYVELNLDAVLAGMHPKQERELSKYPALIRDVSIAIKREHLWSDIAAEAAKVRGVTVQFVGDYYGDELESDKKSVTMKLVMQEHDRTLTDAEGEARVSEILARLIKAFGAVVR